MNRETEDMIKKYQTCLIFGNHQPSDPNINYPIPNQVYTKIAVDPFSSYGH